MTLYLLKMPPALPPSLCSRIVLCIYKKQNNKLSENMLVYKFKETPLFVFNISNLLHHFTAESKI